MFVDLAGFTPLTVALGDSGVAEVLQRFSAVVRRNADACGGRIVKQIGDAFMLAFDRPADAVQFGLDVVRDCAGDNDLPALHVGAHHGVVLYRDGDYFGNVVNLSARITSVTAAGQFLVSAEVKDALHGTGTARFEPLPPRALKGVPEPVPLLAVTDTRR